VPSNRRPPDSHSRPPPRGGSAMRAGNRCGTLDLLARVGIADATRAVCHLGCAERARYGREFVMTSGCSQYVTGRMAGGHARHDPRLASRGRLRTGSSARHRHSCASNLLSWLKIPCAQAEPFSSA
jgi:hypothetical protein